MVVLKPHLDAESFGGNRRKPPMPPVTTCSSAGDDDPNWLNQELGELFESASDFKLALDVVTDEVSYVELGKRLVVDRRTAKQRWLQLLAQIRRGWLTRLAATAVDAFQWTGRVAINPFTRRLVEVSRNVTVVAGCERAFEAVPHIAELVSFTEEVYPTLFGRRGAVLALRRGEGESVIAAVVVPGIGQVQNDREADRFVLAA